MLSCWLVRLSSTASLISTFPLKLLLTAHPAMVANRSQKTNSLKHSPIPPSTSSSIFLISQHGTARRSAALKSLPVLEPSSPSTAKSALWAIVGVAGELCSLVPRAMISWIVWALPIPRGSQRMRLMLWGYQLRSSHRKRIVSSHLSWRNTVIRLFRALGYLICMIIIQEWNMGLLQEVSCISPQ